MSKQAELERKYRKYNARLRNMWILTMLSLGLLSPITFPIGIHALKKAMSYKEKACV